MRMDDIQWQEHLYGGDIFIAAGPYMHKEWGIVNLYKDLLKIERSPYEGNYCIHRRFDIINSRPCNYFTNDIAELAFHVFLCEPLTSRGNP